jgi:toxin ParE1/3/4
MPSKYDIRYLPIAEEDLISIFDWIANDSPSRALSFVEKVEKRIGALSQSPQLGRVPRHPRLKEYGYRVLILDSYLVFYKIRNQIVEIHRVVRSSRNIDNLI